MLGDKLFSYDLTISEEMIEPQLDDSIVKELKEKFEMLINLSNRFKTKIVSPNSYFRHPETKAVIEEIDKLVYERFNIKIQHVNGDGVGYAIITVPPVNLNVVAGDIAERFKNFKSMLNKNGNGREVTSKDVKDKKYIKDLFRDEKSIVYHTYNSFTNLEETLKSKGVEIDLKRAKIKNLPKDYQLFVIADFYMLINNHKLTNDELTAVLLHEIGHGFTHLEYSYRTVANTSSLLDSIRKDLSKGKSNVEAFNLAYKNILNGEDDLTKYKESVATIKLIDAFMESTLNLNKNDRHSFTDSEQLADQFANRFGLGNQLVSALNKLHEANTFRPDANPILVAVFTAVIMILITIVYLPIVLTYVVSYVLISVIFGSDDSNATTYDKKLRRYKRIKNDIIRIIRTTSMDKKDIKRVLKDIEVIDDIMDKASSDTNLIDKLGDVIMPWNRKVSRFQKLEELLEDMSENDLYIASSKLRTLN